MLPTSIQKKKTSDAAIFEAGGTFYKGIILGIHSLTFHG